MSPPSGGCALTGLEPPRYRVPVKLFHLLCLLLTLAGVASVSAQADVTHTLMHQGLERRFVLHAPISTAAPGPRPLVVVLHGSHQPPQELRDWLPMEPIADREGFVVAYPDAIDGRWNYGEHSSMPCSNCWWRAALPIRRGSTSPEFRAAH